MIIVAVGEQTLRRTVPTSRNIFCERRFRVDPTAGSEVGELDGVARDKDVFGLDISVVNAVTMHVVNGLEDLIHHLLNSLLGKGGALALD